MLSKGTRRIGGVCLFPRFPGKSVLVNAVDLGYNTYIYVQTTFRYRKGEMYMERTRIAAIFADSETLSGKEVVVGGWARTIRDLKTFGFIELNDGSCFRNLQVVMDANILANYKEIAAQNVGAALIVIGGVSQIVFTTSAANKEVDDAAVDGEVALAAQVGAGGAGFIDANPDGMDPKLAAMADGAQKAADAYDRDHPDADDR